MTEQSIRYRVAWKDPKTGETKYGEPLTSRDAAQAWADTLNSNYPDMKHWVEKVK